MKRVYGLDLARAFAILGMMLVNYKIVFHGQSEGLIGNGISLLEGRAAAVFLILAGIGLSLMTKKGRESDSQEIKNTYRQTIFKRSLFLFVTGFILYIVFEWSADILHYYGVYMIIMIPIIFCSEKRLKEIIVGFGVFTVISQIFLNYSMGWDMTFENYLDFWSIKGFIRNLFFNGYHPVFPWIIFMLVGLIVGKVDFNDHKKVKKLLLSSLSVALITEVISILLINIFKNNEVVVYFFDTKPMPPNIMYIIAASGWAISFISLCVIIADKFKENWIIKSMVKTGQMALTHYIFHSALVLSVAWVLGLLTEKSNGFILIFSLGVYIGMVIFSTIWANKYKRGPFELLMRKVAK